MKILVVGAGAIGGYYGARLLQAGADVTFLVRPRRATLLRETGLRVKSSLGDYAGPVRTVTRDAVRPDYDLVLLSCKTYDLDAAIADIAPAMRGPAVLLPFLNGMSVYDALDGHYGRDRVLGGVAYIATMLEPDGAIRHFGSNDVVQVGARSPFARAIAEDFHALISRSPGNRAIAADIDQALWNKWVMLASGALMNCLMRGTLADILATRDGRALMRQAMEECSAVAAAEGHPLGDEETQRLSARLLDETSTWAASMMRDIGQDMPRLEADAIVGDMIVRAERHGLAVPLIRASYCNLQVYERQHAVGEGATAAAR
ncbi:2-dehydropantoate 2-reductase [Bordetella genomosp. 11]|uniref:2-dehydropantoate 2-reductase n=1 Tax=Bordetella genomosp. 11 TaxID=1416808 RepID=A0A261UGH7_9BORD|nr:2-dehydropantoate 2-reductase [Bordetella genomosp. 11]OZI60522.1 2-dehydropantoate 2-reductase [Bordetella genomosp. 11]